MPRAGLDRDRILAAATQLLDAEGPAGLSLARLAAVLGVKPPSLYHHLPGGLDALRRDLRLAGLRGLEAALAAAAVGKARGKALKAAARAQRAYARAHPGLYAALNAVPGAEDPESQAQGEALLRVVYAVLAGYGLKGANLVHAARALRAAVGGFVALELNAGFGMPEDADESFEWLLDRLDRGLREG
ncbi:MAG TPA: TetR/AcrR family transcriptional regulator [Deinococcales bacterium]|nr:TetR/AcrR family transcriptional regulator [Deinococcales bacterium]